MPEVFVANATDWPEQGRRLVVHEGLEIGVFRIHGQFYAYQNDCAHRGGPVCQGRVLNRVEEVLDPDGTSRGLCFSPEHVHVVCPWHGFEYDLQTGVHPGDPRFRLKNFPVVVREGEVHVII